jgi:molybdenum cofactor synthesis domain-containing protein
MGKSRKRSVVTAAIVTVSDSCVCGKRSDESGPALELLLKKNGFDPLAITVVPDDKFRIARRVKELVDKEEAGLVLLTGGTGFGPRDVTPEAVRSVIDKEATGLAELMRWEGLKKTRRAALSRSVAGFRGRSLIIALPGSPKGAIESLEAIIDLVPHALSMARGEGHGSNASCLCPPQDRSARPGVARLRSRF